MSPDNSTLILVLCVSATLLAFTSSIITLVILSMWRHDAAVAAIERRGLIDRVQAGSIERLDAHRARETATEIATQKAEVELAHANLPPNPFVPSYTVEGEEGEDRHTPPFNIDAILSTPPPQTGEVVEARRGLLE